MNAHALLHGKRKPKVIEIGLKADDLWWLAWGLAGKSLMHAPIKIGKAQQQELRADGYEVKPIRFERQITTGSAA